MDFPDASRCRERMDQIRILYDTFYAADEDNIYAVDDVTWTDLELDEVFLLVLIPLFEQGRITMTV